MRENRWVMSSQNSSGRLFLTKDFKPHHLRVIYDLFDNDMVDHYLSEAFIDNLPKLIQQKGV